MEMSRTIAGEGVQILTYKYIRILWPLSSELLFDCQDTYTEIWVIHFLRSSLKTCDNCCWAFSSGTVTTCTCFNYTVDCCDQLAWTPSNFLHARWESQVFCKKSTLYYPFVSKIVKFFYLVSSKDAVRWKYLKYGISMYKIGNLIYILSRVHCIFQWWFHKRKGHT